MLGTCRVGTAAAYPLPRYRSMPSIVLMAGLVSRGLT
jgi:hypothetical protein